MEIQTVQNLMAAIRHSFVSCKPRLCTDNVSNRNSVVRNGAQLFSHCSEVNVIVGKLQGPQLRSIFSKKPRANLTFLFKGSVRKE